MIDVNYENGTGASVEPFTGFLKVDVGNLNTICKDEYTAILKEFKTKTPCLTCSNESFNKCKDVEVKCMKWTAYTLGFKSVAEYKAYKTVESKRDYEKSVRVKGSEVLNIKATTEYIINIIDGAKREEKLSDRLHKSTLENVKELMYFDDRQVVYVPVLKIRRLKGKVVFNLDRPREIKTMMFMGEPFARRK